VHFPSSGRTATATALALFAAGAGLFGIKQRAEQFASGSTKNPLG
jgi:hypothetical protein